MYTSTYLCRLSLPHRDDFTTRGVQRYIRQAQSCGDERVLRFFGCGAEQLQEAEEAGWVQRMERGARHRRKQRL